MRIAIVGAGSIGAWLGTALALQGHEVSALARGETLAALQNHGWRMKLRADSPWGQAGATVQAPLAQASAEASELGAQELVVIALKSQALPALAPQLVPLISPNTLIATAMNGVPWWFVRSHPAFPHGLSSVDPNGTITRALPIEQLVPMVVHASARQDAPGVVEHVMGRGLLLGEPGGGLSTRVEALAHTLSEAGFDAQARTDIRYEIWYKLWGNLSMNPISALTDGDLAQILADPLLRNYCTALMTEAACVGQAIGCTITQSPEDRHLVTAKLGAVKTSMGQDVQAGRSIELDALVGAVKEIALSVGVATPHLDSLLGLTRLMAQNRGLYPRN